MDGLNKEVTDPVDDAAIHDIKKAVVEIHGDDEKIIKLLIMSMTGMNMKVVDSVDDAAKYDIEKAVMEICEDDETMIQL